MHQCGLVIALITTYFGFLTHVFCAAKIFQHADHVKKFRDAVEQILDRDLVIVQEPCSQLHASCNRKLPDLAFCSHIAMGIDEQPDQAGSAARDARRRDGEAILVLFQWQLVA